MSLSPLPTPLQQLGSRRFSFYPPILNIGHNDWVYRRSTWSEIVVVNAASSEEACIPRMFIGDVSLGEQPLVVVSLKRELEWRDGRIRPHRCDVIEFPTGLASAADKAPHPDHPAPVINIRLEQPPEKRTGRKIAVAMMLSSVGCLVAADIVRQIEVHQRRPWAQVNSGDTYSSTLGKLGTPANERTFSTSDGRVYRALSYPTRQFTVVLMGSRADAKTTELHYVGAIDPHGRVLNAVTLADRSSAVPLLRALPGF